MTLTRTAAIRGFAAALLCATLLCTTALTAHAKRVDHSPTLLQLLAGIDTVPTAEQLRRATDSEPTRALYLAAADVDLSLYERRRATSLMSHFVGADAEAYLTLLAATATEPKLRWIAIYTYVRGFAEAAPTRVLDFAEWALDSPLPSDREATVRGLRWVKADGADGLLSRQWDREQDPGVRAAIERARQTR